MADNYERELTTDLDDKTPDKPRGMALHNRILIGLAIGVAAGLAANGILGDEHPTVEWIIANITDPVGKLFLRLLMMIVIPLVFSSLVVGVAGVGEIRNGDGVYGLRRALVLAGSESQVMSLWRVSDRGTKELMATYYERLLRGEGRGEALREVQLQMLRGRIHAHPYYWASFIQSGEWANLDGRR